MWGIFFFCEKQNFKHHRVCAAPVYYSSTGLLPSTNVSKICTFRAKMTSKVILINMNMFKKKTTKNKSATAATKCFYLFSYAKA